MRTVFVNPVRKSRKKRGPGRPKGRRSKKSGARRSYKKRGYSRRGGPSYGISGRIYRRNAGIVPFVSNPLIMSPNPPRRIRRRKHNPLAGLNLQSLVSKGLTYGGGAAIAVGANTLFLNGVENFWARNGLRFAGAVASTALLRGELGAAAAGGMFYPLMQEVAAKFLGTKTSSAEADLEGLAADLEDVMDDLDESDLSDDEMYIEDDDDILG